MRGRKWPNKLILKLRPGCHKGPEPCDLLAQADRQEMSGRLQEGDAKGEAMTLSSRDVHQPPPPQQHLVSLALIKSTLAGAGEITSLMR